MGGSDPLNYSIGLVDGIQVQIGEGNAEALAWPTLHYIMSSGIAPTEWRVETGSAEALEKGGLSWIVHPDLPQAIKSRIVGVLGKCGVGIGRIDEGERSLNVRTDCVGGAIGRFGSIRPCRPPSWCLDYFENYVMSSIREWNEIRPLVEEARALVSESLLHRGEADTYDGPVKSRLKRKYDLEERSLYKAHNTIRREALGYVDHNDPDLALMEAQHMGVPTNLIDFTTDPMVALFFASGRTEGHGRLLSLRAEHQGYSVLSGEKSKHRRIKAQKGVFIESPNGVISSEWIVRKVAVPERAKPAVASYLKYLWGLDRPAMFQDLSGLADQFDEGFIRLPDAIFDSGASALKKKRWNLAIERFSEYIDSSAAQRPNLFLGGSFNKPAYFNRALAWYAVGKVSEAIADLERARQIEVACPSAGGPDLQIIEDCLCRVKRARNGSLWNRIMVSLLIR